MSFKEFYFTEMLVIGHPANDKYIVAFDKWIWILNSEIKEQEQLIDNILNKLKIHNVRSQEYKTYEDYSDVYEFITDIQEHYNDVLIGQIQGKTLFLYDYGSFKLDPKSSVLVSKVVKQLKLNSAEYTEDVDSTQTKISKKKMTMKIPDTFYHGTTSKYLNRIMSIGLRAGESESNYTKQGIEHPDLIFFTSRIGEAMHHATHTSVEKGGVPIILEFSVQDKDLIVADFDVEKLTNVSKYYGDTGPNKNKFSGASYKQDPDKLSKEFGIFAYKGNIKPIFIKYVYVAIKPTDQIYNITTDFKKMKPKAALKYLEYMDEY